MLISLSLLLGAASSLYVGMYPAPLGFPFPNLGAEKTVRPTFARIAVFFLGRWLGSILLGVLATWLGTFLHPALRNRLSYSAVMLLAVFLLLFLFSQHSPDLSLAKITDPSRRKMPLVLTGFLSSATLNAPLMITFCIALVQHDLTTALAVFTNFFIGYAVVFLPFLLNMHWAHRGWYLNLIRFFTLAAVAMSLWTGYINFFQS